MRKFTCLALGALLLLSACRKPRASIEFTEASGLYSTLIARSGDDAYDDPEMAHVEELLAKVPANSLDAQAAATLREQIKSERKRIADEAAEQAKVMKGLNTVDVPSDVGRGIERPEESGPDASVARTEIVAGMTVEELKKATDECFASAGPLKLRSADLSMVDGEMYERVDTGRCRDKYPRHGTRLLIFRDGKLVANYDKSELKHEPVQQQGLPEQPPGSGGANGSGGGPGTQPAQPSPAPTPAPAAPPPAPPGGETPPSSPGEQTGPGQTVP